MIVQTKLSIYFNLLKKIGKYNVTKSGRSWRCKLRLFQNQLSGSCVVRIGIKIYDFVLHPSEASYFHVVKVTVHLTARKPINNK